MVKQSDLVTPKSPEKYGSHGNTDDEFEDYSEEEMSSEEESNENVCMPSNKEGSFEKLSKVEGSCAEKPNEDSTDDGESAEEIPCGDDSDDEESNEEDSDEEPKAAFAEYPTEGTTLEEASDEDLTDVSFEEIIEEEYEELEEASDEDPTDVSFEEIIEEEYEELDAEPNGEEPLRGFVDQVPLIIISDGVPSLLEEKKASDYIFSESKASVESSCNECLRVSNNLPTDSIVSKQPDDPLTSSKKRRSKWDIKPDDPMLVNESGDTNKKRATRWSSDTRAEAPILVNDNADLNKRRKTRWSSDENELNMSSTLKLLNSVKDILSGTYNDQRIQRLNAKLQAINQKLEGSVIVNEQPQEESSPSPQPNDDGFDSKMLRLRLLEQKHKIISELTNSNKKDKPEGLLHHAKFSKKLYIPSKEYPNYNFIGLILGPNGNTLKKMEKDTGAIIRIRSKGSNIQKKEVQPSYEDMYVLIESDSQTSFDAAVSMMEKLLVPVDDRHNYHKAAQLRELAELRGTLKEGRIWEMKLCDICGMSSHPTSDCPLTAKPSQPNANLHTGSGSLFSSFRSPSLSSCPLPFVAKAHGDVPRKESDPSNLFVGYLPQSVSSDKLKELFLPYGSICDAIVLTDKSTGRSKESGFVKYTNTSDAAKAIERMNGYMIDGKKLAVKIAGTSPLTLNSNLPNYSGFASISPPSLNANLPILPGLTSIPPLSANAKLPKHIGMPRPSTSNANLPYYYGFASIPPPSNANLPNYPELPAITEEIPKPNFWPGPPGSILPESDISFPKSSCNSLTYAQSMPSQSSTSFGPTFQATSLGKNGYMMDGKAPKVAVSGIPPTSLNANLPNYPGFAAIPGEIPESNCLPRPQGSILSESGTCFPRSCYNSSKYTESVPFRSSTYFGSTCQTSISSSQFPGATEASNELASFPGYLKSFDPSDQLDQSMPSSSLSSRSPYFLGFSGNHLNPTRR